MYAKSILILFEEKIQLHICSIINLQLCAMEEASNKKSSKLSIAT